MRIATTQTVTVKLPRDVASRLLSLAQRCGKAKSELIREGLELRLRAAGRPARGSVLELASDLVGALDGPGDLGTNPRHMRGFGR